jgi:hypothetical protein
MTCNFSVEAGENHEKLNRLEQDSGSMSTKHRVVPQSEIKIKNAMKDFAICSLPHFHNGNTPIPERCTIWPPAMYGWEI